MKEEINKTKELLKELGVCFFQDSPGKGPKLISKIPTGSLVLDVNTGIGGWPEGKIIEIFGTDSSGKTTLALHTIAQAQKLNKVCVYIDLENTLNHHWALKIGVDVNNLYVARPKTGEEVFELIKNLLELQRIDLIIVDSVAALVPSLEFENNIVDQTVGLHARLMSKGLRIIQSLMIEKNTTIIFINQLREKIGGNSFLPSTTTTGGRALRYAACLRVEVKKCESIKDSSGITLGFETKCTIVKNKYGAPFTCSKSAIYFDTGFDVCFEIIQKLIEDKVLIKRGSWIEYEGKNLAQGIQQLRIKLKKNKELLDKFRTMAFPSN